MYHLGFGYLTAAIHLIPQYPKTSLVITAILYLAS